MYLKLTEFFVLHKLIIGNILVAVEMEHYLRWKQHRRVRWATLKLDMAKAYDMIEWKYIEGILKGLSFAEAGIKLIM